MHTLPREHDNVAGAFSVKDDVTGRHILLVDNLFDSGATLEEIAQLLSQTQCSKCERSDFEPSPSLRRVAPSTWHMTFSPDSLAIFLLCSQLGLDNDSVKPLTLHEWNPLVRKMQAASLRPSDLPALSASDLRSKLDLEPDFLSRISYLLSRN